ncbi:MAG: energy-coupling factor transporter ATPase [Bacillota bacterium]|nr:energy-coupling factor transporter ATPase [Bacillota bacterium]
MKDPIIEIKDVSFSYDLEEETEQVIVREALKNVTLSIERGSFVAIVGPNGSGKSTFAKHLNALLVPLEGSILVNGHDTKTEDPILIRKSIGMVFQNPDNQLVSSIVEDDVAFGPENLGVEPNEIRKRVDDALECVSMSEHRKKGPHLLSGGQKQRVAIAGVLAMQTECIVFDEPTAMLDPSGRDEIMCIIKKLHEDGKTIILITHFMEEAALADRIVVMNNGCVYEDATPKELFTTSSAKKLEEISLTLPFAARLAKDLRENGIDVPKEIYKEEEELTEYLCKLK